MVALPGPNASAVLAAPRRTPVDALGALPYTTTSTVSLAYRAGDVPHPLDGYGYWIPGTGPGEVSACTWTSSKIPGRAPRGGVLLRGYVRARGHGVADAAR